MENTVETVTMEVTPREKAFIEWTRIQQQAIDHMYTHAELFTGGWNGHLVGSLYPFAEIPFVPQPAPKSVDR